MMLSEFGKVVRKARIDVGENLNQCAEAMKTPPGYLSMIEKGKIGLSREMIEKYQRYFHQKGILDLDLSTFIEEGPRKDYLYIGGLPMAHRRLLESMASKRMNESYIAHLNLYIEKCA